MIYYKFRSPSEIAFKELLYSEIYFSSTEECNDPCDSKSFYEFGVDENRWEKLFELAIGQLSSIYPNAKSQLAKAMCELSPISFDDVMSVDFVKIIENETEVTDIYLQSTIASNLARVFELYKPESSYFASFSKECDEPLMWAHYGGRHEGFCLVFRSINGFLLQNPSASRTSVRRDTPNSFSPTFSNAVPDKFAFRDIMYEPNVSPLNAFDLFPQSVAMKNVTEDERIALYAEQDRQYFIKHDSWSYEDEARITLRAPIPWLFGDRFEYTQQERLFQYEPSQLVGLIFGARMLDTNRHRIMEIIKERSDRIARRTAYKRIMFNFLLQEARLSNRHRSVDIIPLEFIGRADACKAGEEEFESKLDGWHKGEGIEIDGNSATRVTISQ